MQIGFGAHDIVPFCLLALASGPRTTERMESGAGTGMLICYDRSSKY